MSNQSYYHSLYSVRYSDCVVTSQVVGGARSVSLSDRGQLVYTEATVLESVRMGVIGEYSSIDRSIYRYFDTDG